MVNHGKIFLSTDSSIQLQVSTHNDGNTIGPMASPSPNSRQMTNFVTPSAKGRPGVLPTNVNTTGYPHAAMTRPVSVQIPRAPQQQARMTQSPFSPQSQASQSPHDQFPGSPIPQGMDTFSRPPSEGSQQDQFILVSYFKFSKNFTCGRKVSRIRILEFEYPMKLRFFCVGTSTPSQ